MKQKALIIEDNDNNMELISFILQANNFTCIKAENGQQGFEMAVSSQPDFILLDIQLPDIDGVKVLRMIRQHAAGKDVPVIAITSYAMAGDRERLLEEGCTGYLEKPIDPNIIIQQINNILGEAECSS